MPRVSHRVVSFWAVALATIVATSPATAADRHAPARPNIIIILVDDMGYSDFGCYGSEISTPNIDALAAHGLRFTQFYNNARCCPTRASLLTGLYPHQVGVGHMTYDRDMPGYRGRLNDRCVTIAEVLHDAGYFTAMTGKWHVGQEYGVVPWDRGFERNLTAPWGGFFYADSGKANMYLGDKPIAADDPRLPKKWYSTDLWTDWGLKFIDEARDVHKPFFLYVAHNAPHLPLQAPPADIAKYRGKYSAGWDKLRKVRHAKQIQLGIVDPAWPLSPRPDDVQAWDRLKPAEQDRFEQIMSVYAACVDHIDQSVGRLVAGLRQRGELDNTLILILSDNGGNAERGPNGAFEGRAKPLGGPLSFIAAGRSWATLENTPFRLYKHYVHEGGIGTPLVAHWPAGIRAKGELRNQVGHLIDLMPTCVELAGAKYPAEHKGQKILPMEGTSLTPAFANKPLTRDAIFWEHEGNTAVRTGDWKLVRISVRGVRGPWELYDMKADRTELHDVTAEHPQLVKDLSARWEAWADRTQVKPYPTKPPRTKPALPKPPRPSTKKKSA